MPLVVCVVVAAASLPVASALSYDAWGWLLWGRELIGPLPFTTMGYPSWKPLPGLVSVPLALLGDVAPWVWLLIVRSGAAAAVFLAYRLGRRAAGPWAGVLAAVTLLLLPGWLFEAGIGESEPLLTALLLGALDRHLEKKDGTGLGLAFLAALLRPESWPLLAVSGYVSWRRRPALRPWVGAALVAVPALWFGGDYVGSGSPFTGGHLARISKQGHLIQRGGDFPPLVVLERALHLLPAVVLAGVPVALVAGLRRRDPLVPALCAAAVLWTLEVAVMAGLGYPGIERFLFPAGAAAAIAGAAGLLTVIRAPPGGPARAAVAGVVVTALAVSSAGLADRPGQETASIEHRGDLAQSLTTILATAPPDAFRSADRVSVEGIETTALAWRLGIVPHNLGHPGTPGVALQLRDLPWKSFRRRVARRHLVVRPITRDEELNLVSVTRRQ
jgi:hypothetical protein